MDRRCSSRLHRATPNHGRLKIFNIFNYRALPIRRAKPTMAGIMRTTGTHWRHLFQPSSTDGKGKKEKNKRTHEGRRGLKLLVILTRDNKMHDISRLGRPTPPLLPTLKRRTTNPLLASSFLVTLSRMYSIVIPGSQNPSGDGVGDARSCGTI